MPFDPQFGRDRGRGASYPGNYGGSFKAWKPAKVARWLADAASAGWRDKAEGLPSAAFRRGESCPQAGEFRRFGRTLDGGGSGGQVGDRQRDQPVIRDRLPDVQPKGDFR